MFVCVCVHLGILRSRGTCVGFLCMCVCVGPLGPSQLKDHVYWGDLSVCLLGHPLVKGYVFLGGCLCVYGSALAASAQGAHVSGGRAVCVLRGGLLSTIA